MTAQVLCGMVTKASVSHCVWWCFTPELFAIHTEYVRKSIQQPRERCVSIATDCPACVTNRLMGTQMILLIPVVHHLSRPPNYGMRCMERILLDVVMANCGSTISNLYAWSCIPLIITLEGSVHKLLKDVRSYTSAAILKHVLACKPHWI